MDNAVFTDNHKMWDHHYMLLNDISLAVLLQISGVLYRQNILWIKNIIKIPNWLGYLCKRTFGWLVYTSPPRGLNLPIGATVELQRQEQMDRLEQQLAFLQIQQAQQPVSTCN